MNAIMIVNEIAADREELTRALQAEGFTVVETENASSAVREIWEGSFLVVFIAAILTATGANELAEQLGQMAPEVETIIHSKNELTRKLVKKAIEIRDGVAAA